MRQTKEQNLLAELAAAKAFGEKLLNERTAAAFERDKISSSFDSLMARASERETQFRGKIETLEKQVANQRGDISRLKGIIRDLEITGARVQGYTDRVLDDDRVRELGPGTPVQVQNVVTVRQGPVDVWPSRHTVMEHAGSNGRPFYDL